jgi:hypothetical protein
MEMGVMGIMGGMELVIQFLIKNFSLQDLAG